MKLIKTLVHARTPEQVNFFKRLESKLKKSHEFEYITFNLLTYLYMKSKFNNKTYILSKYVNKNNYKSTKINALEGNGIINKNSYGFTKTFLEEKNIWDLFFVWNGELASEIALKDFAKDNEKSILFFEVGNIKGKIFVDPKGTNKKSILYKDIKILEQFDVDEKEYRKWKEEYINKKMIKHFVPQSTKINLKYTFIKYLKFINHYFQKILGIISDYKHDWKYLSKVKNSGKNIKYDKINLLDEKYIFFPLQVSNDAQIKLNSDLNLLEGLKVALDKAKKNSLNLVIKPHPAEQDNDFLEKVINFARDNDIIISNDNTFKLIKHSEEIITINSTVGLEAKIMSKKVTFLGDSFYDYLDENNIKNYLLGYLIECDYFSDEEIKKGTINKILSRDNLTID